MPGFGKMLKDYLEYHKISQSDFAQSLHITQKHMNEILNENASMSLDLMLAISLITDIDVNLMMFVETKKRIGNALLEKFGNEREIEKFLNQYYIRDLQKVGWVRFLDVDSPIQKAMDLLHFLKVKDFDMVDDYQKEKILYKKRDDASWTKLFLWIRRCDSLCWNQEVGEYHTSSFDDLLCVLKKEQMKPLDMDRLKKIMNQYGIYFVVEEALKGTKVRGCMQVKLKNPAIYLTKLYQDKASFYFSLYHELGHIKKHYNEAKNKIFVQEEEIEADSFALECMIPKKVWEEILQSDFKDLEKMSQHYQIPMCFITSRLAFEKKISYQSYLYQNYKESIE